MQKQKCKCGSREFNVDRENPGRMSCAVCGQFYTWNGLKFLRTSRIKKLIQEVERLFATERKPVAIRPEIYGETTDKEFKKKLLAERKAAIKRIVPKKETPLPLKKLQGLCPEERIRYRWANELTRLLSYGTVEFDKHEHKGKLRGKNIARAFYSDLKRIGIKTTLSFKGMKGIVKR